MKIEIEHRYVEKQQAAHVHYGCKLLLFKKYIMADTKRHSSNIPSRKISLPIYK